VTTASTGAAWRTCPLCEATCGLEIELVDGSVRRIRGDRRDVFSHGYICPKGSSLKGLREDPDRVRSPLVRSGSEFTPIAWDDAFRLVHERLFPIIERHGPDAVGFYNGNPWSHNYEAVLYTGALYRSLGRNRFAAASVDQRPREIVSGLHFGTRTAFPVPDLDRTRLLVLIGTDPLESNGSLATAPDWPGRLAAIRARGGRVLVVDPRRTRTAEVADEHVPIVPGTDAAFLSGLAHTLLFDHRVDPGPAGRYVDGMDTVRGALAPFTPERVASCCGIPGARIRQLAAELVGAPSAAVHGRLGTCLQDKATLTAWLLDVVNYATGNLDRPGGVMFAKAAAFGLNTTGRPGIGGGIDYGDVRSRVRDMPGAFDQLPSSCMAEEMETPGEGQIRGFVTLAGNPVLTTPDSHRLASAFDGLEFMVSIDMYINETTRHADLILPVPSPLERSHYDVAYYQFAVRNVANYSPPTLERPPGSLPEWRIILALTGILSGLGPSPDVDALDDAVAAFLTHQAVADEHGPVQGRDPGEILRMLEPRTGPERLLDLALRTGPYGDGFGVVPGGLSLAVLEAHPHGVDLGPLQPRLPEMLRTPNGRVDLGTPAIVADLGRLWEHLDTPRPGYVLIGRRDLRSNNSWAHNLRTLSKGKERCTLWVNPTDAEALGLVDGGPVRVSSETGSVQTLVEVTDAIMAGVVSLPHGWGHDMENTRLSVARQRPGVNANRLSSADHVDPLSGNPHLNGIPVTIESLSAATRE
jgi:anaerobic selenocysteine-containing dehydrogenase